MVVGWPQSEADAPPRLVVVSPGGGEVDVTATAPHRVVGDKGGGGNSVVPAGTLTKYKTQPFGALLLETLAVGDDWTGTRVTSGQHPVAVFLQQRAHAPTTNRCKDGECVGQELSCSAHADCPKTCCADFAELQMPPVSELGTEHLAVRFKQRGQAADSWRVVASEDNTVVTTTPNKAKQVALDAGAFVDITLWADVAIKATRPVAVMHVMAGRNAPGPNNDKCVKLWDGDVCQVTMHDGTPKSCAKHTDCPNLPQLHDAGVGGPEFVLVTPRKDWSTRSTAATAPGFSANYATIVTNVVSGAALDGDAILATEWAKITNAGYHVGRIAVGEGAHTVVSTQDMYVEWHGWQGGRSYAFASGL